jgi:hypothetical protein
MHDAEIEYISGVKVLFLDESGDHSLEVIDPQHPLFVVPGTVLPGAEYLAFGAEISNRGVRDPEGRPSLPLWFRLAARF